MEAESSSGTQYLWMACAPREHPDDRQSPASSGGYCQCVLFLCLKDEESVDHLVLNCKIMQGMWRVFLQEFWCLWVDAKRDPRLVPSLAFGGGV